MREPTVQDASRPYPSDQKYNRVPGDNMPKANMEFFGDVNAALKKNVSLDDEKVREIWKNLLGHYLRELDVHAKARRLM